MATSEQEYAELMEKYSRQLMLDAWLSGRVAAGHTVKLTYVTQEFDGVAPHYRAEVGTLLGTGDTLYLAIAAAKAHTDPATAAELRQRIADRKGDGSDWNDDWGDKPIKPGQFPGLP